MDDLLLISLQESVAVLRFVSSLFGEQWLKLTKCVGQLSVILPVDAVFSRFCCYFKTGRRQQNSHGGGVVWRCGVEVVCGDGGWRVDVGCGCGMWRWSVGRSVEVESGCGVWIWSVEVERGGGV